MIAINNGVIKNISALCPNGQRYLKTLEEKLKLNNEPGSFNLGFFYKNSEDNNATWGSVKSTLPNKDEFKKLFPSIKEIDTSARQEKKVSEIVEIIKKDILNTLIALEKEHANKADRYHKLLEWMAHISKRVSGLLIFGVTTIAIAAVAAAVIFGIGAFAPTFATIGKSISANAALVASIITATLSLTGISHFISRYILKKRDEAFPTVGAAEKNCEDITSILEEGKQTKIDRTPTKNHDPLVTTMPSAPPHSLLHHNNEPENTGPSIADAFSRTQLIGLLR